MGRTRRVSYPGLIYHIINRGNNRQAIFLEREDYLHYLGLIKRYKEKYEFQVFAYCLMTNHVHLLIRLGEKGNISRIMQSITVAHTRVYHEKYKSVGHVWQGRFKGSIVSDDEYLLTVMSYIEQNPVRARMVKKLIDYEWSSYRSQISRGTGGLLDREENAVFLSLGKDKKERIQRYKEWISEKLKEARLKDIRQSVNNNGAYITERFEKQIRELLPKKRKRGRPRAIKV